MRVKKHSSGCTKAWFEELRISIREQCERVKSEIEHRYATHSTKAPLGMLRTKGRIRNSISIAIDYHNWIHYAIRSTKKLSACEIHETENRRKRKERVDVSCLFSI